MASTNDQTNPFMYLGQQHSQKWKLGIDFFAGFSTELKDDLSILN